MNNCIEERLEQAGLSIISQEIEDMIDESDIQGELEKEEFRNSTFDEICKIANYSYYKEHIEFVDPKKLGLALAASVALGTAAIFSEDTMFRGTLAWLSMTSIGASIVTGADQKYRQYQQDKTNRGIFDEDKNKHLLKATLKVKKQLKSTKNSLGLTDIIKKGFNFIKEDIDSELSEKIKEHKSSKSEKKVNDTRRTLDID